MLSGIDVIRQARGVGTWALDREFNGGGHLLLDASVDRGESMVRDPAELHHLGPQVSDRVPATPLLDLFLGPIQIAVALRVATNAVGLALDKRWSSTGPGQVDGFLRGCIDERQVIPIDRLPRHGVANRTVGYVRGGRRALAGHRHAVLVVLADEYHRQLPYGSQIERLVEGALVAGSIAEECDADLGSFSQLDAEPGTHRDWEAAADDAVGAQVAGLDVSDVHRAAATPAIAGLLSEKIGKHEL